MGDFEVAAGVGLTNRFRVLGNLLNLYKGNRFVCELIFFKVVQMFAFAKLSDPEEDEVRGLLTKSIDVILAAGSQKEKNRLRNRVLEDLKRKRLNQSLPRVGPEG